MDWLHERSGSVRKDGSNIKAERLPIDALAIDRQSREPVQRQIYSAIRDLIVRGVLSSGLKLPASRELAKDISVSRNTVVRVYEQLNSEGYVETRQGSKTFVANLPASGRLESAAVVTPQAGKLSYFARAFDDDERVPFTPQASALRPSTPDVAVFPFKTWNRLLGRHFLHQNVDLHNYNYSLGYPPLQEAIAKYLQAFRGVRCEPEQVLVTNGAQAGLDLLARVLLEKGDVVLMEEPGYVNARLVFSAAGAVIRPFHVDNAGWDLDQLAADKARAIYVTPSSQHPLGVTMRIEQRLRLLEIAHREDAWIIEDDYDSEYRVTGRSIPAMQGSDHLSRIIYIGTFAKTLFPAIRIGFIVLPNSIADVVKRAALYSGNQVSLPLQATLADFLMHGHFARHLRRTRRLYAQRRVLFLKLCEDILGQWLEPFDADVGIQIAFRFRQSLNDVAIAQKANLIALNVVPLSRYYHFSVVSGLFLGYAALDETKMTLYLRQLRTIIEEYLTDDSAAERRSEAD